jgi:ArsR family transcriptional regulator, arsenate/arsenite/antimonite-responsive transcriptional repressor
MNEFFKVLADETRLRCLALIFENDELCVCELIHALDLPQSKISRHLAIIKLNNLVSQRREGQWVLYSVQPELSAFKTAIIKMTIDELSHSDIFIQDRQRLTDMSNRPEIRKCC